MKRTHRFPPSRWRAPRAILGAVAALGLLGAGSTLPAAAGEAALAHAQRLDFDKMWRFVDRHYPFFDEKATDWRRVRAIFGPRAAQAHGREELLHVLEGALDQLYDPHCMLNTNSAASFRPIPHDLFAERRGDSVFVAAVRRSSVAERSGVRRGQRLLAIDGVPILQAAATRAPVAVTRDDPAAAQWALQSILAGRHGFARKLDVQDGSERRTLVLAAAPPGPPEPIVSSRRLPGGLGYLRIASFGDDAAVAEVDRALEQLRDARALLIDVRDNGGGDTAVARPIMGRFITTRRPYSWMARRRGARLGPRWREYVEPRGPFSFDAPVVVLVDRFSVSMAEGFAMGLQGMGRARLVGTRMAGLGAAIERLELGRTHIPLQISAEPVYHLSGQPRWQLTPDVEVDALDRSSADPILDAAVKEAERLLQHSRAPG